MKRQLSIDEVKKIEIEILDFVVDYCEKNGIRYYLAGGTLLGAIRHQGFIPWDDDIDIGMLRSDYERFIEGFSTNNHYKVISLDKEKNYKYVFAKVVDTRTELIEFNVCQSSGLGVYIDVFPIDAIPDDSFEKEKFFKEVRILSNLSRWAVLKNKPEFSFKTRVINCLCRTIGTYRLLEQFNKVIRSYKDEETKYVSPVCVLVHRNIIFEKSMFDDLIQAKFENKKYLIPARYDEYLTAIFGDYMLLPPMEERVSHHSFDAYIIEND